MFKPLSTYRIQFHKDFTFVDLERVLPYLEKLGVNAIYASPVFEATPGSVHGYDVVNPLQINPEIGTIEQLRELAKNLKATGIGWIQDIVPNHMAFHSNNLWLMDVLEKGRYSVYSGFFDLSWTSDLFHGKLIAPVLGSDLSDTLDKNELQLAYHRQRIVLCYYDNRFPLHPRSYAAILDREDVPQSIQNVIKQIRDLHTIDDAVTYNLRWHEIILQLDALSSLPGAAEYFERCLAEVNADRDLLLKILGQQNYELTSWQTTDSEINFRRFFTINNLIGMNMQDEKVFTTYHQLIKDLVDENIFQGLRIDHIDGLYDPTTYLQRLRELTGPDIYVVVEKILHVDEALPVAWPVQGTTGYDFLSFANNLISTGKKKTLSEFYSSIEEEEQGSVSDQILEKKSHILYQHMRGELDNLCNLLFKLELVDAHVDPELLKEGIAAFLIHFPVYRFYGNVFPLEETERSAVHKILRKIGTRKPELAISVGILEDIFLTRPQSGDTAYNDKACEFYMRCMQFTGPLMAKGVEDTLMYTFNRFIGQNEVGDSPLWFGMSGETFHEKMASRQKLWPLSMNATATHDTKRGEDSRMWLAVLTEVPVMWTTAVQEWMELNAPFKENNIPDANDEYLLYQVLIGSGFDIDTEGFEARLHEYLTKALREAKRYSDWANPNQAYENGVIDFCKSILRSKKFRRRLKLFTDRLPGYATSNSLTQLTLKYTTPGVPDLYQGCELWDFSFVDPDNRRSVDYRARTEWLEEMTRLATNSTAWLSDLFEDSRTGKIKQWICYRLIGHRNMFPDVFTSGTYVKLETYGTYKDHILAFARRYKSCWCITVVPLHLSAIGRRQKKVISQLNWKDTGVTIPAEAPQEWENILTMEKGSQHSDVRIKDIFKKLPLAVLKLERKKQDRGAGILMSISSLPSPFGVGDLGPEAYAFADFLYRTHQSYWQLLPLTPTDNSNGFSPYSTSSGMAGNVLLISPVLLVADNLLLEDDLKNFRQPHDTRVDFMLASQIKDAIVSKAWTNFKKKTARPDLYTEFNSFVVAESYWLDEYALFTELKRYHGGAPWYEWMAKYKRRDTEALKQFSQDNEEALMQTKWSQFIFFRQWKKLKDYCESLEIKMFGDLPFYVCHDSVDVWTNRELFSLDENGNVRSMAGVPPDYFNSNGQLWGMPVFNWDVLRQTEYRWWIDRIKKNLELYDVLRLDHFRAFASYWEVPGGEATAVNGRWKPGPGSAFFHALNEALGDLPFVAEDLGDIDQDVHQLRDEFKLPGMKVLQFAFAGSISESAYSPHNFKSGNFVVYTGTHDNNTTRGWFRKDVSGDDRHNLETYIGHRVNEKHIHIDMIRLAYSSIARIAIVPMQDILGLPEETRMNIPGEGQNNWTWRMKGDELTPDVEERIRKMMRVSNRM